MLLITVLLVAGLIQQAAPQAPGGTAVVKGQVIDKQTGTPLPRAVVTLRSTRGRMTLQNSTDQEGRFEFTGVPAGSYDLRASAGQYRSTHVSTGYSVGPGQIGSLLELKDGEERSNIVIALPRARAISGWRR